MPTGPLAGENPEIDGATPKFTSLNSVPPGVTTRTLPVVAPAGTVVVISELETTVKGAAVPLKLTLVAPVRLVPRMVTGDPKHRRGGQSLDEGAQPHIQAEDLPRAIAVA